MTRWTSLSAEQLADLSAKNRARRVSLEDRTSSPRVPKTAVMREADGNGGGSTVPKRLESRVRPRSSSPQPPQTAKQRSSKRNYAQKLPIPTEHQEQCRVIDWFDLYAPTKGIDPRLLFAIPNGADKSMGQAMKFKREGLRAGMLDLMLAVPQLDSGGFPYAYAGLFVELKRSHGAKVRDEQTEYCHLLTAQGYKCVIALGADQAIKAITEYLS